MEKKNELQALSEEEQNAQLEMSRRNFLVGSALGLGGLMLPNLGLAANVLKCNTSGMIQEVADPNPSESTAPCVVYIFLRGGADGLSMVAPHNSDTANYNLYRAARPNIKLDAGIRLGNSKFMLHPRLNNLHEVYQRGKLAVLQGAGSPNNTRSHFDQMAHVESGAPLATGASKPADGFFNRILTQQGADIQAASLQAVVPQYLLGPNPAVAIGGNLNNFVSMAGSTRPGQSLTERVIGLFAGNVDRSFCAPAAASSAAVGRANSIVADLNSYNGISPLATYAPAGVNSGLGSALRETLRLLKGSPGTRVVSIDVGGWDTHMNIGVQDGYFASRMDMLNHGLATFQSDIRSLGLGNRVITVVMSEFGRPLAQNGSLGLDHGRGGAMFVMGEKIRGGMYARDWDLARLHENRDLRVTIDYRDVFGQILTRHLGANLAAAFPSYSLNTNGLVLL